MNDAPQRDRRSRFLRVAWLVYAIAAIALSIAVLAIFVKAYDDYDVSDRVRSIGRFARQAMRALSFPLGAPSGALLNPLLEKSFGCGDENEPCAIFIDWNTHFAALLAQIVLLRWLIGRR